MWRELLPTPFPSSRRMGEHLAYVAHVPSPFYDNENVCFRELIGIVLKLKEILQRAFAECIECEPRLQGKI